MSLDSAKDSGPIASRHGISIKQVEPHRLFKGGEIICETRAVILVGSSAERVSSFAQEIKVSYPSGGGMILEFNGLRVRMNSDYVPVIL